MRRQLPHARSIRRCPRASLKCSLHSESLSGMTRFIPRYSTLAMARLSVVKDEGGSRRGHRPSQIHGDLRVAHLPALLGRVVVAVFALGRARTVVVDGAAELAHVLDDHGHAVRVALAQVPSRRIVRPATPELDDPARHVLPALALLAEAVVLELKHGGEGEGVIGARDVDV